MYVELLNYICYQNNDLDNWLVKIVIELVVESGMKLNRFKIN